MTSAQTRASPLPSDFPTRITNCSTELASALPSVIRLEADALLRERGVASAPESVAVQCDGDHAHITVHLAGKTRDTTLELIELAPPHRARAVALAAAELLHSLANAEDSAGQPPPPPPAEAPLRPSPRVTTEPLPPRTFRGPALLVGAVAEWLGKPATPLFGAHVALHYRLGAVVVPALSADASFGSASTPSAHVAARTFGGAAHLFFETTTGNLRWSAGPGARIGWARLTGNPPVESTLDGRTLSGVWGGPEARTRIEYRTSPARSKRSPLFALEFGIGVVTLPVRGLRDGADPVYSLSGPWLSLCLEVGLEL